MPLNVIRFEPTPNPAARKFHLDGAISPVPRSFLRAEDAADDPVATALFARLGLRCVLFNTTWLTINKNDGTSCSDVDRVLADVLAGGDGDDSPRGRAQGSKTSQADADPAH